MLEIYASRTNEVEQREIDHRNVAKKLALECMVLLENDGVLPFKNMGKVALYGNGARETVKGGSGSGAVNSRENMSVEQGFLNAGFEVTTTNWLNRQTEKILISKKEYSAWCDMEAKRKNVPTFAVSFDYPYREPSPVLINEQDVTESDSEVAVYVLSRNSGEGADRLSEAGDYMLYPEEKQNLTLLANKYRDTIVVLNIGGVMDLSEIRSISNINAILLMGQLGNVGGEALVDVLMGKENPSGKTTDTWANRYMDYPSSEQFSHNGSVHDEDYTDGVFIGYRYFDTFQVDRTYCFGYGRSYTDFSIQTTLVERKKNQIDIIVEVKNIGSDYAGKEVVQVYYSAPHGKLDQPFQELAAFQKTSLLQPGTSQVMTLSFQIEDMASYSEEQAAWILEKGNYIIRVGNSSMETEQVATIAVDGEIQTENCKNLFPLDQRLDEIKPQDKKENEEITNTKWNITILPSEIEEKRIHYQNTRQAYTTERKEKLTLQDVMRQTCTAEELVAQMTIEEMAELTVGTLRANENSVVGNASYTVPGAAGDTASVLKESRGVKGMILADGPAGIRLQPHFKIKKDGTIIAEGDAIGGNVDFSDSIIEQEEGEDYYQYCTAIPVGWSLAQSWNEELVEAVGDMVGEEMEQFHIDLWLAPALNIHRNPLCGRNFEYYSEEPLIAGKMAAAMTKGVQKHKGKGTTIKHFAANNQEDNRYFLNAHVSERALREIYLKGFEIAVKEASPLSIMTSYNLINGIHTANSYDLLQSVARDEWGFAGIIMTDWFTSQNMPEIMGKYGAKYPISASTGCIYAGNDIQMPGCQKNVDDIVEAVKTGNEIDGYTITKADLQFCTANIIRVVEKMSM